MARRPWSKLRRKGGDTDARAHALGRWTNPPSRTGLRRPRFVSFELQYTISSSGAVAWVVARSDIIRTESAVRRAARARFGTVRKAVPGQRAVRTATSLASTECCAGLAAARAWRAGDMHLAPLPVSRAGRHRQRRQACLERCFTDWQRRAQAQLGACPIQCENRRPASSAPFSLL